MEFVREGRNAAEQLLLGNGGELGLFPNASDRWHNQFQVGDVPDSGSTLLMILTAVVLLFSLDTAMRRCVSARDRNRRVRSSFP